MTVYIIRNELVRRAAIDHVKSLDVDGKPFEVEIRLHKDRRSLAQNRMMWSMLSDISAQVIWHSHKLTAEEWKDVLTASLKSQKVVPGIDTPFVVIGSSTRRMTIADMADLITLMQAFGVEQGVKFKDNSGQWADYEE